MFNLTKLRVFNLLVEHVCEISEKKEEEMHYNDQTTMVEIEQFVGILLNPLVT